MKNIRTITLMLGLALTLGSINISAQSDAGKAFVDAPQSVFPLLDRNTRLDMIDYFKSNLSTPSSNNLDGKSRITSLDNSKLELEMTGASSASLSIMPGSDLISVITTVATPAPDSRIDFYSTTWQHLTTETIFKRPEINEWLTTEGKKNMSDIEAFVPFVLMSYSFDPATGILTVTNNTSSFLSPEINEMIEGYLRPSLTYMWNGKKFQLQK